MVTCQLRNIKINTEGSPSDLFVNIHHAPLCLKGYSTWSACMFVYLLPGHAYTIDCSKSVMTVSTAKKLC